jgi:hypothetical protein
MYFMNLYYNFYVFELLKHEFGTNMDPKYAQK